MKVIRKELKEICSKNPDTGQNNHSKRNPVNEDLC